jgi:hypothetical protein
VRRIGPLAGARDAAATLAAVDALRACLWAAALDARGARVDGLPALAERLAEVALVVGSAALTDAPGVADAPPQTRSAHADRTGGAAEDESTGPLAEPPGWARPDRPAHQAAGPESETTAPTVHDLRAGSVTELPLRSAPPVELAAEMDDGDVWIHTLERHVDRAQREGGGLALLRVELVDGERLALSAETAELGTEDRGVPYGRLAQAIRRAIRRQDLVASDRQGRAWVIAPAVGRAGAIALAERIAAGVEHGEHWRGAPLAATIGFAVYGEDGRDAATLIERAEEAMLAASAAGVRIGEALPVPDGEPDGEGGAPGPRLVR